MPLILDETQRAWLSHMQQEWVKVMKPFVSDPRSIPDDHAFVPIPTLKSENLSSARLVSSRNELLTRFPKGGVVAEVGTQYGYFARRIYDTVKPASLHLFDLSFESFDRAACFCGDEEIFRHVGDSHDRLSEFDDGFFDWLYIDADHSYNGVKRDIEQAVRVVKDNGFLVFNDFTYWSPLEAVDYVVPHAVCELCLADNWEVTYFALAPLMYCDIVIRRRTTVL